MGDDGPLVITPELQAAARRTEKYVGLREAREAGRQEVALLARALIIAGLPLRETTASPIIRRARLGSGERVKVVFHALNPAVPIPYGSDANLLHFLIDRVNTTRTDEPFIEWRSVGEYLDFLGLTDGGRKLQQLKERWNRITNFAMWIGEYQEHDTEEDPSGTKIWTVIHESSTAPRVLAGGISGVQARWNQLRLPGHEYRIWLNEYFWKAVSIEPVPIPREVIRKLHNEPLAFRLCMFLGYRCFAAETDSVIPWSELRDTLGVDYGRQRDFTARVADALQAVRLQWPEVRASATHTGLCVGPPEGGRQLLMDGSPRRRLTRLLTAG